ncbi:MAG: flagellar hook protein FlgE [Firmicutes bacterium]|nr:flagellar hook protein FlgE [Bacillota bacterium]
MMRSMFAGVSGLRNHQTRMDVIGNNIANVNTVGYKTSRVTFADALSQTLRGATAPHGNRGGINPQQVGIGVTLSSIDVIHSPGNLQTTGVNTDLAIQGNGFFMLGGVGNLQDQQYYYTRAGNFNMDISGRLVYSNGLQLLGWIADIDGTINTAGNPTGITLPVGSSIDPRATSELNLTGNLNSSAAIGESFIRNMQVFDSLGVPHTIQIVFTKTAVGEWDWEAQDSAGNPLPGASGTLNFDTIGHLPAGTTGSITGWATGSGADALNITIDFSSITQHHADESTLAYEQDGYRMGYLDSFRVDSAGRVIGIFTNGLTRTVAQIAIATCTNPAGLEKMGDTMFRETNNSGTIQINLPGVGGAGMITAGALEMSNVDLSQEFTDMIVTQRGFQANSRIITTSDEMLQELVNLKR